MMRHLGRRALGVQSFARKPQRRHLQFERLEARQLLAGDVVISEILASNSGGLRDSDGDSSDWIELFNRTSAPVNLTGYSLKDSEFQWTFPAGTVIGPRATLLVFASDKGASGPAGELHTNFKLSASGEYLGLIQPDGVTVEHEYAPGFPEQQTNVSYGLSMTSSTTTLVDSSSSMRFTVPASGASDATWRALGFNDNAWITSTPGIGYEGNPGSANEYTGLLQTIVPAGTTSAYTRFKFNVANPSAFSSLHLGMLYDDGFVAYLNGQLIASANAPASPVWNSAAGPINRTDDVVLSQYVDFDATAFLGALQTGDNVLAIHALNQAGSSDFLMIPRLTGGTAQVVEPLVVGHFATPTPKAPNGQVFLGIVGDTSFSVDRGFYSAPFDVTIATSTPGAIIVYTTNGSAPTVDANLNVTNGTLYSAPVHVAGTTNLRAAAFKLGFAPTNVDTQTYIFTSDVIHQTYQSAINSGLPASWGSRSADYGLDPDVIGPNDLFGGVYAGLIESSLKAIPTLSLTLDNADFFGPSGIYTNVFGTGIDWERPTSAELIFPDGTDGFQIDAGMRINGEASRSLSRKNGFRLHFRSEYGAGSLDYPLFGDGVDEFNALVLRPHFNDGWGWDGAEGDPLYGRDQWFRDTQAAMGHDSSRGNVVHLYVNGLYWGLYNPSERLDDAYAASYSGGDISEYDVISNDGAHDGTGDAYATMIGLAQAVNSATTAAAKHAAYMQLQGKLPDGSDDLAREPYLDVVNYIDYMILNHYGGNNDWPDRNWYAIRRRGAAGEGFQFYAWDSEISLANSSRTSINENNLNKTTGGAELYGILRNYDEFRLQFADRIHHHLFNGGALYVNPANPTYNPSTPQDNVPAARFAQLASRVYAAMVAESARWGDQHVSIPRTRNFDWQNELNYMLGTYFRDRHNIVLNQWRAANLYPATIAPELLVNGIRQHGGATTAGALLSFLNSNAGPAGAIYYTTDGSDPRLVGGAINTASAQLYSSAFPLGAETHIKARVLRSGQWSALTEATFVAAVTSADFDVDGDIDGADFLAWQRGLGSTGNASVADGDADGDLDVDASDLGHWKIQFGTSAVQSFAGAGSSHIERVTNYEDGQKLTSSFVTLANLGQATSVVVNIVGAERGRSTANLRGIRPEVRSAWPATAVNLSYQANPASRVRLSRDNAEPRSASMRSVDGVFEEWDELDLLARLFWQ
jgi:hypothetical protein